MNQISDHHQFNNFTPQTIWNQVSQLDKLILPTTIRQHSSNHYVEIGKNRYGFQLKNPWGVLPQGEWSVIVSSESDQANKSASYDIAVSNGAVAIYSGHLHLDLSLDTEQDTICHLILDGEKGAGLVNQSDELVETFIRGLIREGWDEIDRILMGGTDPLLDQQDDLNHMAPLAVAAGVFSAGMALGLWFWRRKKQGSESKS
ncbi:MAG: hypothetical protein AAGD96_12335 [Chloroflexota bacterium]